MPEFVPPSKTLKPVETKPIPKVSSSSRHRASSTSSSTSQMNSTISRMSAPEVMAYGSMNNSRTTLTPITPVCLRELYIFMHVYSFIVGSLLCSRNIGKHMNIIDQKELRFRWDYLIPAVLAKYLIGHVIKMINVFHHRLLQSHRRWRSRPARRSWKPLRRYWWQHLVSAAR